MQETSNYKLNKWESTDRIQMEDFNEDNRTIDEALAAHDKALTNVLEKVETVQEEILFRPLAEWSMESNANSVTLDLSGYTTNYRRLYLYFDLQASVSDAQIRYYLNGKSTKYNTLGNCADVRQAGCMEIFPAKGGDYVFVHTSGAYHDSSNSSAGRMCSGGTFTSTAYANVTSITFQMHYASAMLLAGSNFSLYGLK